MSATDAAIFLAKAEESLAGAESEFANSQLRQHIASTRNSLHPITEEESKAVRHCCTLPFSIRLCYYSPMKKHKNIRYEKVSEVTVSVQESGTPFAQLMFQLVASHLGGHYHNDQDSSLQAELEALRQEHGEFETFIHPNGNIHLHTQTPLQ
jgi:hypothetical protein